jgi:hypothetical protein
MRSAYIVVDIKGTFSYVINQDNGFVTGGLPPGMYHVVVTAPGHVRSLVFEVEDWLVFPDFVRRVVSG